MELNAQQRLEKYIAADPENHAEDKYMQQPEKRSFLNAFGKNIVLAILTHSIWSALPVLTRYLLVKAPEAINSLILLSSTKLTAFILIFLFGDYDFIFKIEEKGVTELKEVTSSSMKIQESEMEKQESEIQDRDAVLRSKVFTGLLFSLLTTCRAALGIECLRYTTVKNASLIQSLLPLIVPIADALFLKTKLSPVLWRTVTLSVLGCSLVVISQHSFDHTFTESDVINCLMNLMTVLITAITRLIMKTSANILTRNELLTYANVGTVVIPLIVTLCIDLNSWLYFVDVFDLPKVAIVSWSLH